MKSVWASSWKGSKQPRKQRKYVYNAPMHVRRKFLGAHLSKELKQKYGTRTVMLKKGDKVKVLRGSHKNHIGKVDRVDATNLKIYLTGIEVTKKDGSKAMPPFRPSNLMITELDLNDRKRELAIKRKGNGKAEEEAPNVEKKDSEVKKEPVAEKPKTEPNAEAKPKVEKKV